VQRSTAGGVSNRCVMGFEALAVPVGGTLIAIGNFDGVHAGHRALIQHAVKKASEASLLPVAMTFHPHPAGVLSGRTLPLLTTTERKVELLLQCATNLHVIVQPFDHAFAQIEAEDFVERILLGSLRARFIVVGNNFHFGRARRGTPALLQDLAGKLGFAAQTFGLSGDAAGSFSSSRVRTDIAAGNLEQAAQILGRPHAISGVVVQGDQRGRSIGFPTANLAETSEVLPPVGVYGCVVDELVAGQPPRRLSTGVMNIGPRPTVNRGFSVEVHLLDFCADLYAKWLRVHIIEHLRGVERFADLPALRRQIAADISAARQRLEPWVGTHGPH
jgi:riboflavin kinase/FMN adenylyltransferase